MHCFLLGSVSGISVVRGAAGKVQRVFCWTFLNFLKVHDFDVRNGGRCEKHVIKSI